MLAIALVTASVLFLSKKLRSKTPVTES
jgi:hypothetical protein